MRQQLAYSGEGSYGPYMAETSSQRRGIGDYVSNFYESALDKSREYVERPYKGAGLVGALAGAAMAGPFGPLAWIFGALLGGTVSGSIAGGYYWAWGREKGTAKIRDKPILDGLSIGKYLRKELSEKKS